MSTVISALNSLTLSPALAALLLKPHGEKPDWFTRALNFVFGWFFRGFNRVFGALTNGYARLVKGQIWATEAGGIVGLKSPSTGRTIFPYSPSRAASSMRYLFQLIHMPQVRGRYTRAYVYCFFGAWDTHEETNRWDSGLLGLNGKPRPAYSAAAR